MTHVEIPEELANLLRTLPELDQALLVGGCVRDALRGESPKDVDVEVFGVNWERLCQALGSVGRIALVGKSFGVLKMRLESGLEVDFSLPRRESKIGAGHKGFDLSFDATLSPKDAAARRDFTINALAWNPRDGRLLDFFGGENDLRRSILRHTSTAFSEDPLRPLRGMQFAARFGMTIAPETVALCRAMLPSFHELPVERVRDEWLKWATKSTLPSAGLRALVECGWVAHFPEIDGLRGCAQDPEWHPEGDVFTHTCHCCDAMAAMPAWKTATDAERAVLMFAILAHDFGKPSTTATVVRDGRPRIVSHGHEPAGGPIAETFLARIAVAASARELIVPLVVHHLAHLQTQTPRGVRRLAARMAPATLEQLGIVIAADHAGRPPLPPVVPSGLTEMLSVAEALHLQSAKPTALLSGRHVLAMEIRPGPEVGRILALAFEAQLDGEFADLDGALEWLKVQRPHFGAQTEGDVPDGFV